MHLSYKIINSEYVTIKQVLREYFHVSERFLLKLKQHQGILLNGEKTWVNKEVHINDVIEVFINYDEESDNIISTEMKLNILFEDEYLLVINKPSGIAIHPSCNHYINSLSNGVKFYFDQKNLKVKIRPVNRLDKDTSGVVIFAKNSYIQELLIQQMKYKIFQKEYLALVIGRMNLTGEIVKPIKRNSSSIIERCVAEDGDYAKTIYDTIQYEVDKNISLVHFILETGRTHQIRVHTAYINHPILGDSLYGEPSSYINRQALHSWKVKFEHPITKTKIEIIAELPNDIKSVIDNK